MSIHTYFTNCFTSVESTTEREIQFGSFFFWSFELSFQSFTTTSMCEWGKVRGRDGADEMDCFGSIIIALHCKTESKWIKHFHS